MLQIQHDQQIMSRKRKRLFPRHCEERSDEAIHLSPCGGMDCFASLAMTRRRDMHHITLDSETDFDGWRKAARTLALNEVKPSDVSWRVAGDAPELVEPAMPPL